MLSKASSSQKRPLSDVAGNPRGGRQQKVRRAEEQQASQRSARDLAAHSSASSSAGFLLDSYEALSLLKRWCSGDISAVQVQSDCYNIYKDQCALLERLKMSREHVLKSIQTLAALGSWGRLPGNINKELLNLLGDPLYPKPTYFKLNARVEKPRLHGPVVSSDFKFGFILPHVLFFLTYSTTTGQFSSSSSLASTSRLLNFATNIKTFGSK